MWMHFFVYALAHNLTVKIDAKIWFFHEADSSQIKEGKKHKEVRVSLTSLFLQWCKVPFNDHIFFHENALPFSVLCSLSDNCLVCFYDSPCFFFIFLIFKMLASEGHSWNIPQMYTSSLWRARHSESIAAYEAGNQDLRISRKFYRERLYFI